MSYLTCDEQHYKTPNETLNAAVSFKRRLAVGEKLTGTPVVTISPSGPTLSSKAVNTSAITLESGTVCDIGQAVQFSVTGGTADTKYTITAQCGTDASVAQTLEVYCVLTVKDE